MTTLRSVSVAQTCPIKGDVSGNVEEHLRLANLAASQGAQVVLFPELSLTGYEIELANQLAFSEGDSRLGPLVDTASSRSITIIAGAPVRIRQRLYIGAFILGSDGATLLYTKHRLGGFGKDARSDGIVPPAEKTVFQSGDRNPLVQFCGNSAALAVCADIGPSSHPQQATDRGAKTYLASMFVIPSDFEDDSAKLSQYAANHSIVVAMANFGSPTGGLAAAGRSSVWSPTGGLLAELNASGPGVAVATETSEGWRGITISGGGVVTTAWWLVSQQRLDETAYDDAIQVSISIESPREPELTRLIEDLDAYQTPLYPRESNHLLDVSSLCAPNIRFLVARKLGEAVGCAALRVDAAAASGEVKRMFVRPQTRGLKVGRRLLSAIEDCARLEGLKRVRLETGIHQHEALALYRKTGYRECDAFGTYRPDPLSVFMEKAL